MFRLAFHKCTLTVPYQLNWCFTSMVCHFLCTCLCNIWWKLSQHLHLHWRGAPRRLHLLPVLAPAFQPPCWSLRGKGGEKKTQQLPFSDVETHPWASHQLEREEGEHERKEKKVQISPQPRKSLAAFPPVWMNFIHTSIHEVERIRADVRWNVTSLPGGTCAGG